MNATLQPDRLRQAFRAGRGALVENEPLSRHTSWRVGGPARYFYRPADVGDVVELLQRLPDEVPLWWLGLGSNLLVRDGGLPGVVIATAGVLDALEQTGESTVRVEVGVPSAKVARFCARAGLVGAEFLAGIPGTLGGALAMNAGAFGGETWPLVSAVETVDRRGVVHLRRPEDFRVGYREVHGPAGEWFLAAHLRLSPGGEPTALLERIKDLLARRGASQPTNQPSCGSVFRNPPGDHAGRLIESAGLKGQCIGGACVSERHANFIVNTGQARAADIEALIHHIQKEVERVHGVTLVPEVHIVGEPA